MITVESCNNRGDWDEEVLARGGHPLQLWGWGETKAAHNWKVDRVFVKSDGTLRGGAQLLVRRLPGPFSSMVYIPRGPVCEPGDREAVLEELAVYAKHAHKAIVLTVEPDWEDMPFLAGWRETPNTILIPHTLILDLNKSENELMEVMAKKTRQYIRKSLNEGIVIRQIKQQEDIAACLEIYKQTAKRVDFELHDDAYYYDIFNNLGENSPVFAAYKDNRPVAFLWLAISETTAFELYGGMNDKGQQLRANYALKWQVIQTMKRWGIKRYDFNGLLNDGVSTFKQGFSDHETILAGTFDRPLSPLYPLWTHGLPFVKKIIRAVKKRR